MMKKVLAAAAALVMCFSMVACGDSASSGDSKGDAASPWSDSSAEESKAEESKAEESKAEESKAEESKAEESKAEESQAEESKAEESQAEESKAEEPLINEPEESKAEESKADESKADESKAEETPAASGNVLKGTNYTMTFPDNWLEFKAYKEKVNEAMKKEGKSAIMLQPFGSEYAYYCADDLNIEDGVTYLYTAKPSTMSAYKGHSVTEDTFKNALESTIQNSYKSGKLESSSTIKVGGADALKYEGVIPNNGIDYKTIVIITLSGSTLYQYGFATPVSDYSARSGDLDAILNSVTFTEE